MPRTILIIGATGVFGRRLAAHLARSENFELLLASRSLKRADELVRSLVAHPDTRARVIAIELDVTANLEPELAQLRPEVVVDCSGPFQGMDYRTPRAALSAGAHFVDLADARGYLLEFEATLDPLFRSEGLVALAGASSSPALAAAAVSALTSEWSRIDHIDIAITPGGQSEVGEAAVAAALSYCGKPVPVVAAGELGEAHGWSGRRGIAIRGLGARTVAPVETADAELLAAQYPAVTSIRFWAGLESSIEQLGLRLIAKLTRWNIIRRPERIAPVLTKARKLTRLTTGAAGGMRVRVVGLDRQERWTQAEWRLVARNNDGPHVPPSPAAAAVRAILAGKISPGARPATSLPLTAIEAEFEPYAIATQREMRQAERCFVQTAIGDTDFMTLPRSVRAFHGLDAPLMWSGLADVDTGTNFVTRLVARVMGLPATGRNVPVSVLVERRLTDASATPTEVWTRSFAGKEFVSVLNASKITSTTERFGPLIFRIGLAARDGKLGYPVAGWRLGPLPLPLMLAPRSEAYEWQDEQGRFNFDVRLELPFFGVLAHYRGWLTPRNCTIEATGQQEMH